MSCALSTILRFERVRRELTSKYTDMRQDVSAGVPGLRHSTLSVPREHLGSSRPSAVQHFDYTQWECVMVREKPEVLKWAIGERLGRVSNAKLKGNIGFALAHLTLWDFIARQPDTEHFLIFEDNALATPHSVAAVQQIMQVDYDMLLGGAAAKGGAHGHSGAAARRARTEAEGAAAECMAVVIPAAT